MKVIIRDKQYVVDLSANEEKQIKEKLTFKNPQYEQVMKYTRYRYTRVPQYLFFYERKCECLIVPRGFNLHEISDEIKFSYEWTYNCEVHYPKFKLELREAQKDAAKNYLDENFMHYPYAKSVIQLPTGKGKTILALYLAHELKAKTLILVHKDDLVTGWQKDIKLCFGDDFKSGLIKAKKREVGEQITIATVQTFRRLPDKEKQELYDLFDFVVQDESHHINPNMFGIISDFSAKFKLGLSATPVRSDGMNYLFDLYLGGLGYEYDYKKYDEDICSAEVIFRQTKFKYEPFIHEGVIYNYYDFDEKELPKEQIHYLVEIPYEERPKIPFFEIDSAIVKSREYILDVCADILKEYRQGHSILVLFSQKEHIRKYNDFLSNFIPEEEILLYYGDNKESSEVSLQKAESGEARITLASYSKATEGTNVKRWEVLFLVSSLNNEKNVEQAVGRIRRKMVGKLEMVRIYDYRPQQAYTVNKHVWTRLGVYEKLQFNLKGDVPIKEAKRQFSLGYRK